MGTHVMLAQLKSNIQVAGTAISGEAVKLYVQTQVRHQTYPFDYRFQLVGDSVVLEKAMTYKEKRDAEKAAKGKNKKSKD